MARRLRDLPRLLSAPDDLALAELLKHSTAWAAGSMISYVSVSTSGSNTPRTLRRARCCA
jgi:hypothetical protein